MGTQLPAKCESKHAWSTLARAWRNQMPLAAYGEPRKVDQSEVLQNMISV
jgi:hypothetical protein